MTLSRISRVSVLGLLALLLLWSGLANAQIQDLNEAINKAGRERMLSQRMAKAYLQLGQEVDRARSQRAMDSSIALFDRQLVELKNYAPTAEIRQTYLDLEQAWIPYKDVLVGTAPRLANGAAVIELSDKVLALAHQGTVQLEALSRTTTGRVVNISGRQRMLSQRMARNYQALSWGVSGELETGLAQARSEFAAALDELSRFDGNTPALNSRLELVRQQWFFFESALDQQRPGDRELATHVATTSERILETMEEVVQLYERLDR